MGTTTNGLPYPEPTDSVDYPRDSKALADAVDAKVLPFGFARARCTTSGAVAANAWNIVWLDVLADVRGAQPWTLDAPNRSLKILKAGVYLLSAQVTMNAAGFGVAIGTTSAIAGPWDRIAGVAFGTSNQSTGVTTVRYLAANTYVVLMQSAPSVLNITADGSSTPTHLLVQALGGQ